VEEEATLEVIEVVDLTLVEEETTLEDIEVVDLTLVEEEATLEVIEVVDLTLVEGNLNSLKEEILNHLDLENLNLQAAVKMVKKRIIKAGKIVINAQAVKMVKNRTELSFIKQ
jgi:predicted transposase YdaD